MAWLIRVFLLMSVWLGAGPAHASTPYFTMELILVELQTVQPLPLMYPQQEYDHSCEPKTNWKASYTGKQSWCSQSLRVSYGDQTDVYRTDMQGGFVHRRDKTFIDDWSLYSVVAESHRVSVRIPTDAGRVIVRLDHKNTAWVAEFSADHLEPGGRSSMMLHMRRAAVPSVPQGLAP